MAVTVLLVHRWWCRLKPHHSVQCPRYLVIKNLAPCSVQSKSNKKHLVTNYTTRSLQYKCPIILKAEMVSGTFGVQKSHRSSILRSQYARGFLQKALDVDLVQVLSYLDANRGAFKLFRTPQLNMLPLLSPTYYQLPGNLLIEGHARFWKGTTGFCICGCQPLCWLGAAWGGLIVRIKCLCWEKCLSPFVQCALKTYCFISLVEPLTIINQ